ncbi:aminotransferase class I/II-fold pyridoxal phosphate-dependent enzyme [Rhodococcus sp. KBS0724]|uniref:aminotransferase class I/II-fold pyridoxal phosphate-dependent enzyme n=1 Tax=Rhodococcus sp. KBS0724 TaxID=1179674 RepID=UPI00110E6DC7|nr:aminotransferase class I/II-fold pyridoxal phosphate-dependent enzyme [Rhodococcus sp. KBS0724]TSD49520.1 aminotransferase class I/II-fold pyridoxal phosphate-dependent enzyme [Rhodococcus sp. KBS0724]
MSAALESEIIDPQWLVERTGGRAADLADAVADLIRSGDLRPGDRLPTVRALAQSSDFSVGAIVNAWGRLQEQGFVQTRRRGGTVVLPPRDSVPERGIPDWRGVDLAQNAPDLALQPSLSEALLSSLDAETLNVFGRELMTERLRDAVAQNWPFEPEAWATAGGGTEALLLAVEAAAPPGSIVAVDEPLGPGVLDTLRDLGLDAIGVAADHHGPRPDALDAALAAGAVAFVFQPGAPFAVDHEVSTERIYELAEVLGRHPKVWVVEDDSIGPLEPEQPPSLGGRLPHRVVRIRSYCKAYGIDVRTSVLGGSRELIERAMTVRSHGVGSNSRILQNTLAHLITSADAERVVSTAHERYAARRATLVKALTDRGIEAFAGPHSLVVWVRVSDETASLVALARQGISVGAGSRSFVQAPAQQLLRLSATQLPDDDGLIGKLADVVAGAVAESSREFFD